MWKKWHTPVPLSQTTTFLLSIETSCVVDCWGNEALVVFSETMFSVSSVLSLQCPTSCSFVQLNHKERNKDGPYTNDTAIILISAPNFCSNCIKPKRRPFAPNSRHGTFVFLFFCFFFFWKNLIFNLCFPQNPVLLFPQKKKIQFYSIPPRSYSYLFMSYDQSFKI